MVQALHSKEETQILEMNPFGAEEIFENFFEIGIDCFYTFSKTAESASRLLRSALDHVAGHARRYRTSLQQIECKRLLDLYERYFEFFYSIVGHLLEIDLTDDIEDEFIPPIQLNIEAKKLSAENFLVFQDLCYIHRGGVTNGEADIWFVLRKNPSDMMLYAVLTATTVRMCNLRAAPKELIEQSLFVIECLQELFECGKLSKEIVIWMDISLLHTLLEGVWQVCTGIEEDVAMCRIAGQTDPAPLGNEKYNYILYGIEVISNVFWRLKELASEEHNIALRWCLHLEDSDELLYEVKTSAIEEIVTNFVDRISFIDRSRREAIFSALTNVKNCPEKPKESDPELVKALHQLISMYRLANPPSAAGIQ